MIEISDVCKRYGPLRAVCGVTAEIRSNGIIGLLGENGAGKTTLFNMLTGYLPPDSGGIRIGGIDALKHPLDARRIIGYLPEEPPLYPEMTVREYLAFCIELKGVVRADRAVHLNDVLCKTMLESVADRQIANLSHGFKQRVGFAQALCGNPDILLLDEPTNGLDPSQMIEMRGLISSLAKDHIVVVSSHILSFLESICGRILIMHKGRLIFDRAMTEASAPLISLVLDAPLKDMLPALRDLPSVRRVHAVSAKGGAQTRAEVETADEGAFARDLAAMTAGKHIPILKLAPLENPLEEIYLAAIRGEEKEHVSDIETRN